METQSQIADPALDSIRRLLSSGNPENVQLAIHAAKGLGFAPEDLIPYAVCMGHIYNGHFEVPPDIKCQAPAKYFYHCTGKFACRLLYHDDTFCGKEECDCLPF